jgi:FkbM family methyltransferase
MQSIRGQLRQLGYTADALFNAPLNRHHRIGAVGRYVAWQLRSRITGGGLVQFVNNTRLRAARGMSGATGNIYCGLHEFAEMGFALHLLRPHDVFFDVGANVGAYSVLASSVGAYVYAFEPGERFDDLQAHFTLNRIEGRAYRTAVGAAPGTARFLRGCDTLDRIALPGETAVEVPMISLDSLASYEIKPPMLLKIDVEGYEGEVIAGAEHLLRTAPPMAIIMETGSAERFGHDEQALEAKILAAGYRAKTYDPLSRKLSERGEALNAIYVRPGLEDRLRDAPPFRVLGRLV